MYVKVTVIILETDTRGANAVVSVVFLENFTGIGDVEKRESAEFFRLCIELGKD